MRRPSLTAVARRKDEKAIDMGNMLEDRPHPVPPMAFLKYKENWFFIILSKQTGVYGVVHINTEPGMDRARFSCHMSVDGQLLHYSNETTFPHDVAMGDSIGDSCLRARFIEAGKTFEVTVNADFALQVRLEARFPTYDFIDSRHSNPTRVSGMEVLTCGANLPYTHQQQALTCTGEIAFDHNGTRKAVAISGDAYRDHSWGFRGDNLVARHTWSGLLFKDFVIGVKTIGLLARPNVQSLEGYVADARGIRPLRDITVIPEGSGPDGMGAQVTYILTDHEGTTYTIDANIDERLGYVPLTSEKPGAAAYGLVENFCDVIHRESGATGISLTELGRNSTLDKEHRGTFTTDAERVWA
jgi:hypothetical protein